MTKDELSLLLFFETAYVDHGGLLCIQHMNDADREIARRWTEDGYVRFERICSQDLQNAATAKNHCVWLSEKAIDDAHAERKARALRCWADRRRRTTSEYAAEKDACSAPAITSSNP